MRFDNLDDVQALVDDKIPESPSLEYKRELHLDSQPQRREVLKDLTAMGNGGGGTIVYGVDESSGDWPVASAVTPLTERALVSRLENVVRDAVRPPLLWDLAVVAADEDGFVLAIDVLRSPLGPYMVQAYGSMKYHVRVGRRTEEMTEALVRDAYELAGRARDRRAEVWSAHSLPVPPPTADDAWLSVSALPEEPLIELVDVAGDPTDLRPIGALASQAGHGAFSNAVTQWHRWADGFFGSDGGEGRPPYTLARVHRDAAAAIGVRIAQTFGFVAAARVVNAQLAYIGWLWQLYGLARPAEIAIRLDNIDSCALNVGSMFHNERTVRQPEGVPLTAVSLTETVLPWELTRASRRHQIARRFTDRLLQAFGEAQSPTLFESGQLYRQAAGPLGVSVAGGGVWEFGGRQLAFVHSGGAVRGLAGDVVAWWSGGALCDLAGDTLAVTEMAVGDGCPDGFLSGRLAEDPRARVPGGDPGEVLAAIEGFSPPVPTGRWADTDQPLAVLLGASPGA